MQDVAIKYFPMQKTAGTPRVASQIIILDRTYHHAHWFGLFSVHILLIFYFGFHVAKLATKLFTVR